MASDSLRCQRLTLEPLRYEFDPQTVYHTSGPGESGTYTDLA